MAEVVFAIPGDVDTPTGGYRYDRRVIDELRALRWDVKPLRLPGDFPAPSEASLQETERLFAAVPVDALLLVDGLAFGALPASLLDRVPRKYVALVHHPLGLETGLAPERAESSAEDRARGAGARAARDRDQQADGGSAVSRFRCGEGKDHSGRARHGNRATRERQRRCAAAA